ncbi:twin-arginine translocase subunit TatC [Thermochromatium tepidum]|uniref:Sec-independent protein translocase protein TatC n=1 Tax=Thermochromatium tepidum ATCC 43061 TaxID=316276 RepID=A0A6I6E661_THETI|nr:twin-arginine translocase subunit TatC [Thermochromatium tepidum]QGU33332.1 twin-arginine translocase subunit TatC [Thermochromatium tepidum ATCC 43061]
MPLTTPPDDPGAEQPFISHLVELRDRIIRMLIAVGVMAMVLLPFANQLYTYVAAPLLAQLPEGNTMIATQVASPLLAPFKLALIMAVFLAMPYLLYQIWAFVAPGLYQHEKRLALPLLVSSILLFYLGTLFAYYVVFPLVFAFMVGTTPEGVAMMTDISAYLDFVLTLFFAFGVAFEIPIATILLVAIGAVTPEGLVQKRPYVIVGVFVIGMLLTPPDVISQTLLAVPMWLLFELGILLSRLLLLKGRFAEDPGDSLSSVGSVPSPLPVAPSGGAVGCNDPDRSHTMTDTELERRDVRRATQVAQVTPTSDKSAETPIDPVEDKILRANQLRDLGNELAARQMLYQVLEEGDAAQRQVARNILTQLDEH